MESTLRRRLQNATQARRKAPALREVEPKKECPRNQLSAKKSRPRRAGEPLGRYSITLRIRLSKKRPRVLQEIPGLPGELITGCTRLRALPRGHRAAGGRVRNRPQSLKAQLRAGPVPMRSFGMDGVRKGDLDEKRFLRPGPKCRSGAQRANRSRPRPLHQAGMPSGTSQRPRGERPTQGGFKRRR